MTQRTFTPSPVTATDDQTGPPSFPFEPVRTAAWRLLEALEPVPRLVGACAPPGYGKTVLLAGLHRACVERGLRCLWLTLDDRDRDVSSLLRRLQHGALRAGAALPPPQRAIREASSTIDRMLQWAASLTQPTLLFIDNLGFCDDPGLPQLLDRLLFGRTAHLHLVLSSTRELPLDMARAKLELGAVELGTRHLGFDRAAADQLLRQAGISGLRAPELDRIMRDTEGWAAALRLLQVLLSAEAGHGEPDPNAVLSRFTGDDKDIASMLTRRVLVGFDPALVRFMVELSLLREFNAELAQQVTGQSQAAEWLAMLVHRSVLTFPLDSSRRWFRFHTLLRQFLRAEADERIPVERRCEVLTRAAEWHRQRHDLESAVDLALQAPALDMAIEMLDRIAAVTVGDRGHMGRLIHWVDRLIAAGGEPTAETHAWYVWALCDSLQYERGVLAMAAFDRRVARDPALVGSEAHRRLRFSRMLTNVFLDRLDSNVALARSWIDEGVPSDALTQAAVISFAAICEMDRGEFAAAASRMEMARAVIERSDSPYGLGWVYILQALDALGLGRPDLADAALVEGHRRVAEAIGPEAAVLVTMRLVHARALVDLARDALARDALDRALPRAGEHGYVRTLESGLSASLALWEPETEHGTRMLELIDRAAMAHPPRARELLAASKVRRLLQLGQIGPARAQADSLGLGAVAEQALQAHGDRLLAELEMLLAQGQAQTAIDRAEGLLRRAQLQGRERDRVELLLLVAEAHVALGQARRAMAPFSLAIALAAPGQLLHPFRVRANLVRSLVATAGEHDFSLVVSAQRAFYGRVRAIAGGDAAMTQVAADASADGVALTLRQRELLALLSDGLGSEELAGRLGLTVPTVKWHLHRIYVTLGVKGRVAALARARSLGLIGK